MTNIIQFEPKPNTCNFFEDNKVLIDNIYIRIESKLNDPNTDDITKLEAKLLLSILEEDDSTFDKTADILQKVKERGLKVIR